MSKETLVHLVTPLSTAVRIEIVSLLTITTLLRIDLTLSNILIQGNDSFVLCEAVGRVTSTLLVVLQMQIFKMTFNSSSVTALTVWVYIRGHLSFDLFETFHQMLGWRSGRRQSDWELELVGLIAQLMRMMRQCCYLVTPEPSILI